MLFLFHRNSPLLNDQSTTTWNNKSFFKKSIEHIILLILEQGKDHIVLNLDQRLIKLSRIFFFPRGFACQFNISWNSNIYKMCVKWRLNYQGSEGEWLARINIHKSSISCFVIIFFQWRSVPNSTSPKMSQN